MRALYAPNCEDLDPSTSISHDCDSPRFNPEQIIIFLDLLNHNEISNSSSFQFRSHRIPEYLSADRLNRLRSVATVMTESPLDAYDSRRTQIGRGRFATVYKTTHLPSGDQVAMKILTGLSPETQSRFVQEYHLLQQMSQSRHPNVISILACFIVHDKGYLIMPLCEGGTLATKLAEGPLPDREAARVINSVLRALAHVHSQNILHRDVKPENILYRTLGPDSDVLLGDFGLGKVVEEGLADSRVGTKGYQAPQVLQGHLYDCKCDIWSTGVVAFELLHAALPFKPNQGEAGLLNAMERTAYEIDSVVSAEAADFIRICLRPDPQDRPVAARLLNHPWFA
jgi:calcium/calmodulin-dependent protein kinase I